MRLILLEAEDDYEIPKDPLNKSDIRKGYKASDNRVKTFSDKELEKLSEEELIDIIESKQGLNTDRNRYINAYLEKVYGEEAGPHGRLSDAKPYLISSIGTKGIKNNKLLQYVQLFLARTNKALANDYAVLADNMLSKGLFNTGDSQLYDQSLYDEDEFENVYKLKALMFLKNPSNIRSYGLYKKDKSGKTTNNPLTVNDIRGKSADEVRELLNSSQTRNFGDDGDGKEVTFNDVIKLYGGSPDAARAEFNEMLKARLSKSMYQTRKRYLEQIFENPKQFANFKKYNKIKSTEEDDIADALINYIGALIRLRNKKKKDGNLKNTEQNPVKADAIAALVGMQYKPEEVKPYIEAYYKKGISVETLIHQVLQAIGRNK